MGKGVAAVIMVILIIGAISGYLFYTRYVLGTVVLSITDPPSQSQSGNSHQYDPTILHIYLTFSTIDIHQGGLGNPSNSTWTTIVRSQRTVDMISVLTTPKVLGTARLSTGIYDQIRFPVSAAIATFSNLGNVTYSIPSGSLKITIAGGGFQSSPGSTANLLLTISFDNTEILAMNGRLTPHATAQIVA